MYYPTLILDLDRGEIVGADWFSNSIVFSRDDTPDSFEVCDEFEVTDPLMVVLLTRKTCEVDAGVFDTEFRHSHVVTCFVVDHLAAGLAREDELCNLAVLCCEVNLNNMLITC